MNEKKSDQTIDEQSEVTKGKKNITYLEIKQLIKRMNLNYSNNDMKEIVKEVGIDEREIIHLDELIEKSKTRRSFSKYSEFYEGLLNLFITPSERIVKILQETKDTLLKYKEERLVRDLEWVIKKIHNDDIYNLSMDLINDLQASSENNPKSSEMQSVIKFLEEFSTDSFTKSKKEDLKTVKDLSNKRMEGTSNKSSAIFRLPNTKTSASVIHSHPNMVQTFSGSNGNALSSFSPNNNRGEVSKYPDNNFLLSPYSNPSNYSSENVINLKNSSHPKDKLFSIIQEEQEIIKAKRETYHTLPNKNIKNFLSENEKYSTNKLIDSEIDEEDNKKVNSSNDNIYLTNNDSKGGSNKNLSVKDSDNLHGNTQSFFPSSKSASKRESFNLKETNENNNINNTSNSYQEDEVIKETNNLDETMNTVSSEDELKDNVEEINTSKKHDSFLYTGSTNLGLLKSLPFKKNSKLGRVSLNIFNRKDSFIENWNTIDDVEFNIFEYCQSFGRENIMVNISDYIFDKYGLYSIINSKRFETFLDKIRVGYDYLLPYHNDLHAADVLQTSHIFANLGDLRQKMDLTSLDLAAFFIACIIHDFKHPGLNNNYQINKKTDIATKYNDISVLENYHVSSAFKVISHPNSNIFCDLSIEEYRVARKRIVECVLSTDMAKHTKSITSLKIKFEGDKTLSDFINITNEETKFDRQQEILNFLIHMADISNPGKKFNVCRTWSHLVMEEFFLQGDLEKREKLPVSFLCDRDTTNIPKSQAMFISNIVVPSFKLLTSLIPSCIVFLQNMYENIEHWNRRSKEKNRKY